MASQSSYNLLLQPSMLPSPLMYPGAASVQGFSCTHQPSTQETVVKYSEVHSDRRTNKVQLRPDFEDFSTGQGGIILHPSIVSFIKIGIITQQEVYLHYIVCISSISHTGESLYLPSHIAHVLTILERFSA